VWWLRWTPSDFGPFDLTELDDVTELSFAGGEFGVSGFDFDEDDFLEVSVGEAVEDDEVDGAAEEAGVFRVIGELREEWHEVFGDFAHDDVG